jgi:hypothetical protein
MQRLPRSIALNLFVEMPGVQVEVLPMTQTQQFLHGRQREAAPARLALLLLRQSVIAFGDFPPRALFAIAFKSGLVLVIIRSVSACCTSEWISPVRRPPRF